LKVSPAERLASKSLHPVASQTASLDCRTFWPERSCRLTASFTAARCLGLSLRLLVVDSGLVTGHVPLPRCERQLHPGQAGTPGTASPLTHTQSLSALTSRGFSRRVAMWGSLLRRG